MNKKLFSLPEEINEGAGLTHRTPRPETGRIMDAAAAGSLKRKEWSGQSDMALLQSSLIASLTHIHSISSIDELLERDNQREKDGFPRKIRIGRMVRPSRNGKEKIILVPATVEEKFIHDTRSEDSGEERTAGGSGDGQEGDVIGEEPVHSENGSATGAGQGEGGLHGIETSAYDLGRVLSEKFQLPNIKDKGKKRSFSRYTFDLTDRHLGTGQVLDKKATLKRVIETNINLNNIPDVEDIDPAELLISPADRVYRILSKEKEYESPAMVFFIRDYSGSMTGKPTETVVTQHVLIYSWLLYQYDRQVETRFILHDSTAKEVADFHTYYNSTVAGGTNVVSAYRLVNEIVETGNFTRDYNIYVFHGTDGDDWDPDGSQTIPELKKMVLYANRVGITIAESSASETGTTRIEQYIKQSHILEEHPSQIRLDTVADSAGEERLIESIKILLS